MVPNDLMSQGPSSGQGNRKRTHEEDGSKGEKSASAFGQRKKMRTSGQPSNIAGSSRLAARYGERMHKLTISLDEYDNYVLATHSLKRDVNDMAWNHIPCSTISMGTEKKRRTLMYFISSITGRPIHKYQMCIPEQRRSNNLPEIPLDASTGLLQALRVLLRRDMPAKVLEWHDRKVEEDIEHNRATTAAAKAQGAVGHRQKTRLT